MDLKSRSAWSGFFLLVIPAHPEKGARAGGASQQPNGWSSRASVFSCRAVAIWLACRGLPTSCRRRKA